MGPSGGARAPRPGLVAVGRAGVRRGVGGVVVHCKQGIQATWGRRNARRGGGGVGGRARWVGGLRAGGRVGVW